MPGRSSSAATPRRDKALGGQLAGQEASFFLLGISFQSLAVRKPHVALTSPDLRCPHPSAESFCQEPAYEGEHGQDSDRI
jgi:hypothetical protein